MWCDASNTIQVPTRSGKACTLLRSSLTQSELANCTLMTSRAYAPFYRVPQPGYISGANIMDMVVIGISAGLLENNGTGNVSRIADAYERAHNQVVVQPADRVDGIKPDGSFQQHAGIIYNGRLLLPLPIPRYLTLGPQGTTGKTCTSLFYGC